MKYHIAYVLLLFYSLGLTAQTEVENCSDDFDTQWGVVIKHIGAKEFEECIEKLKEIRSCALSLDNDIEYAYSLVSLGDFKRKISEYDSSEYYLEELYANLKDLEIKENDRYGIKADMFFLLGYTFYDRGWYEQSLEYYHLSINTLLEQINHVPSEKIDYEKIGSNFSFGVKSLFNNTALIYYRFGDYDKAIEYYDIALELLKLDNGKNHSKSAWALNIQNQALNYLEKNELEKAKDNFDLALGKMGDLSDKMNDRTLSLLYKNMAIYYSKKNERDKTEEYINKALSKKTDLPFKIILHQTASNIYTEFNDMERARTELEKAYDIIDSIFGFFHPEMALNYSLASQIELKEENYETADSLLNIGLNILNLEKSDVWDCETKNASDFTNKRYAFKLIKLKTDLLKKINSKKTLDCLSLTSELVKELQQKYMLAEESKYYLANTTKDIYNNAIKESIKYNELNKAYEFLQKSKSMILLSQIQEKTAANISSIPDEFLERIRKLKLEINTIKRREQERSIKEVDHKSDWENERFVKNREYEQIIKEIEGKYPLYHNLKYQIPEVSLNSLQQKLEKQSSTLIEYFLGENNLFIFVLDKDNINAIEVKIDQQFFDDINTLNQCVSEMDYSYATFKKYQESSNRLYDFLLSEVMGNGWVKNKNLIIISDEQLNLIPFEALVTKKASFNDTLPHYHQLDYLIKDFNVSYHYSSNLIGTKNKGKNKATKQFIGIAPTFKSRDIQALENNISEIENAVSYYPSPQGFMIKGESANYENILKNIGDYKMAHFATHAIFNDQIPLDSRIEFSDTSLYIYEIFGMEHQLDLVIMSACETASGKRRKGEGVVSLSRAFIQSGCSSVIASLWSISDQKTSILMKNFHEYFSQGKTAKVSLSEAKRKYISEAMTKNVHPFYWAGFIQIGTVNSNDNLNIPFYYYLLGIGFLFIILWLIWKWKK